MKYLTDYTDDKITELLETNGAFFAFGSDQFNKQKKEGVKYVSLGSGLICPKENTNTLLNGLDLTRKQGIKEDLRENGKMNIIKRELYNHESFYTYDIDPVVEQLKDYDISREEIQKVFNSELKDYDFKF